MKVSFIPKTFICECGIHTKEYVWSNDLKAKCKCGKELNETNILKTEQAAAIRTPTKNR